MIEEDHDHDHKHEEKGGAKKGDHAGHNHENMNLRAAIVHVIGDIIQSIGVVIAAQIIFFFPKASIADPITTMIFTVICIFTTVPIFKECMSVLMEATPKQIDVL